MRKAAIRGMDARYAVVLVLMLLFSVGAAMAAAPISMTITNCGIEEDNFGSVSYSCGDNVVFTCNVYDTASTQGINQFSFFINGEQYNGYLRNGTAINGTWVYDFPVNDQTGSNATLDSISAINAAGVGCSGSAKVDSDSCFINFTSYRSTETSCTCVYDEVSVCGPTNIATITHSPGAGCSGGVEYTSTAVCDFCDPEWTAEYVSCQVNRSSANPLTGYATKTYYSANPQCCLSTGADSDCNEPVDAGASVVCSLDYWGTYGKTVEMSSSAITTVTAGNLTGYSAALTLATTNNRGLPLRPLLFDWENDGRLEAMAFTLTGFRTYTERLGTPETIVSTGYDDWEGQPAMFGFQEYRDGMYIWDIDLLNNDVGGGVAGIVRDDPSGVTRFVSYRYQNGSFQNLQDIAVSGIEFGTEARGSGTVCFQNDCFFQLNNGKIAKVNAVTGATTVSTTLDTGGTVVVSPAFDSLPALVVDSNGNLAAVVVKGAKAAPSLGLAGLFSCTPSLAFCYEMPDIVAAGQSGAIYNMSSPIVVETPGGTGAQAKVYVTWLETDLNNESIAFVGFGTLSSAGTWVGDSGYAQLTGFGGGQGSCISNPVPIRCLSGQGVGFATYYTPELVQAIQSPELNWHYDYTASVVQTLDGYGASTANAYKSLCTGDVCYQIAGVTGTCQGSSQNFGWNMSQQKIYKLKEGGITQVSGTSGVFYSEATAYNGDTTQPCRCRSTNPVSTFGIGNDLYVVLLTPAVSSCYTTGQWDYVSIDLWKYTESTDSWSQIDSTPVAVVGEAMGGGRLTTWPGGAVNWNEMMCETNRCWFSFVPQTNGYVKIWEYDFQTNTVEVHQPPSAVAFGATPIYDRNAGMNIYGYVKTDDARYYAVGYNVVSSANGGQIFRYDLDPPNVLSLLDGDVEDDESFVGLHKDYDEPDTVYWARIPHSTDAQVPNGLCSINLTGFADDSYAVIIESTGVNPFTWEQPYNDTMKTSYGGCNSPHYYDFWKAEVRCDFQLRKSTNGGSPTTVYNDQDVRMNAGSVGAVCGGGRGTDLDAAPFRAYAQGGEDPSGDHYVIWYHSFPVNALGEFGGHRVNVEMVISTQGLSFPYMLQYTSPGLGLSTATDSVLDATPKGFQTCTELTEEPRLEQTIGTGCFPYSFGTAEACGDICAGQYCGGGYVRCIAKDDTGQDFAQKYLQGGQAHTFSTRARGMVSTTLYTDSITGGATAISSNYAEYYCYVPSGNTLQRASRAMEVATSCPVDVSSVDLNDDGYDDLVSSSGVFGYQGKLYDFPETDNQAVYPADITADTYTDFIFTTGTELATLLSNPSISAAFSTELSMTGLVCTFDAATKSISATGVGIGAQNPTWLSFEGVARDANGKVVSAVSGASPTINLPLQIPGSYTVTYVVRDTITAEAVSRTCTATAPSTAFPSDVSTAPSECSLKDDGEFNFASPQRITDFNWVTDTNAHEPIILSSTSGEVKFASFQVEDTNILHGLACENDVAVLTVKAKMTSTSNTKILLEGENKYGVSSTIGGLWLYGGAVYLFSSSGELQVLNTVPLDVYSVYELTFDEVTQQYQLSITPEGGLSELIGSAGFVSEMTGDYSAITIRHVSGRTDIDYIRLSGTGTIRKGYTQAELNELAAYALLDGCSAPMDRNFTSHPPGYQGGIDQNLSKYYENVEAYCLKLREASSDLYCDFSQLKEAVRYNGDCYKEAFDYCIDITYPQSSGFQDDAARPLGTKRQTLDGAAACNLALGISTTTDRVVSPSFNALKTVLAENWLMTVVLLVIVFIVIGSANRRQ